MSLSRATKSGAAQRIKAAVAVAAAVFFGVVGTAAADGDPASDYLVGADVYLPFPVPTKAASAALLAQVRLVYDAGYWIKVAVVASTSDLGSVPSLMDRPTQYARFLGAELSSIYAGPLLILMPSGFGIYDEGTSTTAEQRVLDRIRVPPHARTDDLMRTATNAVAELLQARALSSKDRTAPIAYPQTSVGRRGQTMKLDYQVVENSERSRVTVEVLENSNKVATFHLPLQRVTPQTTYSVAWHIPPTLPEGPFTLCVSARDASGNQGPLSCAAIQIT